MLLTLRQSNGPVTDTPAALERYAQQKLGLVLVAVEEERSEVLRRPARVANLGRDVQERRMNAYAAADHDTG